MATQQKPYEVTLVTLPTCRRLAAQRRAAQVPQPERQAHQPQRAQAAGEAAAEDVVMAAEEEDAGKDDTTRAAHRGLKATPPK